MLIIRWKYEDVNANNKMEIQRHEIIYVCIYKCKLELEMTQDAPKLSQFDKNNHTTHRYSGTPRPEQSQKNSDKPSTTIYAKEGPLQTGTGI